jgi:hypothetical protein
LCHFPFFTIVFLGRWLFSFFIDEPFIPFIEGQKIPP